MRARLLAGLAVAGLTLGLARPATTASEPVGPPRRSTICDNEPDGSDGGGRYAVTVTEIARQTCRAGPR